MEFLKSFKGVFYLFCDVRSIFYTGCHHCFLSIYNTSYSVHKHNFTAAPEVKKVCPIPQQVLNLPKPVFFFNYTATSLSGIKMLQWI